MTLARLRIFKRIVGENVYSEGLELPSVGTKAHSNLKSIRPPHGPYPSVKDNPANTLGRLRPDVLEGLLPAFTADCEEFGESPTGGNSFAVRKDESRYICDPRLETSDGADPKRRLLLAVPAGPLF